MRPSCLTWLLTYNLVSKKDSNYSETFLGKFKASQFTLGKPFAPLEQLMGVLPSLSSALVPAPLAELMTAETSPILHFYPLQFESDLNGKRNAWEAVVKIPFIDEKILLQTLHQKYPLLTPEELERNQFGSAVVFEFKRDQKCILAAPSASFPTLEECHVHEHAIQIRDPPREQLRRGLTPGVRIGTDGPPTFPSLKATPPGLSLHGSLQHLDISVFPGAAGSKSLTMALTLISTEETETDLLTAESVHFNWPHLIGGQLVAISDGQSITLSSNGKSVPCTPELMKSVFGVEDFGRVAEQLETTHSRKKGIILAGGVQSIVAIKPFKHLRRDPRSGAIEQVFADEVQVIPAQLLITNLPNPDVRKEPKAAIKATDFTPGMQVMCIERGPNCGRIGAVEGVVEDGRRIKVRLQVDPSFDQVKIGNLLQEGLKASEAGFLDSNKAAEQLQIPAWLLSKMTSTMQVMATPSQPTNLGLGVKFEGKSLAVPSLARRGGPGKWMYSGELISVLKEYKQAHPRLFEGLAKLGPSGCDRPSPAQLGISANEINEARAWLKTKNYPPSAGLKSCEFVQYCQGPALLSMAQMFEASAMASVIKGQSRSIVVKPENLITSAQSVAFLNAESASKLRVGDAVVWMGDGADGLPFGDFGLVVGAFGEEVWVLLAGEERRGVAEKQFSSSFEKLSSHRAWSGPADRWMRIELTSSAAKKPIDKTVKKNISYSQTASSTVKPVAIAKPTTTSNANIANITNAAPSVDLLSRLFAAASIEKDRAQTQPSQSIQATQQPTQSAQASQPKQFTTKAASGEKKFTIKKKNNNSNNSASQ